MNIIRTAEISECGRYRWWLGREFPDGNGTITFVMLNPSTADADLDDPTIRRCMGFARSWGFRKLMVRNLFPYRATDPSELLTARQPDGGERGLRELGQILVSDKIVLAWGSTKIPHAMDRLVLKLLDDSNRTLYCLGTTANGSPRHPLYVRADQPLIPFPGKAVSQ